MASLVVHLGGAAPAQVPLVKALTTVGAGADSDVRVDEVRGVVAIQFDGSSYMATALEGAPLIVNGKKRERAHLSDGDTLQLGRTRLVFQAAEAVAAPADVSALGGSPDAATLAVLRLSEFTLALAHEPGTEKALARLLDAIIEVVRADKGFLIVVEDGAPRVEVARNFQRQDIQNAVERLSDSIVERVLQTRQPVIVSDALTDAQFNASASVVNLKLSSVMCVPLIRRGELYGAVYVGNDRIANLFTERELLLMTSFCATAALLLERALELDELRTRQRELESRLEEQAYGDIIGACDVMRDIFRKIDKVAAANIDVLVTGESGTGKELIARELHRRSPRKAGPFVAINCGAIPENLLESELFGHAKGAFTGAVAARPGKFQAASGGTLFLDEIGDMPHSLQVKLLRALQDRQVTRVGENRPEPVDIRIVSATNKDLDEEMKGGRFREDLFYRVNVVHLHLPPLRERGEDAVMLAKYFLSRATRELGSKVKGFGNQALVAIKRYRWPGNIRQLENRIKKAVVLADKPLITPDDLELRAEQLDPILPLAQARDEWQKRYINEVLERNGGNRTKTAKDLGVDPRTIFRHLERMEAERRGEALPPDPLDPEG
ncbi:MAG TPA: sigma 54-interacting transcriptional regulator [Myxococcales bacterium]|jgi:transcriptional regulator with GAF, ATPase, and Fis domain|nr:sigma 54-interacting transcriptional regulator [Myxococcales bacterium]